jgi:WD40 repeat protein
VAVVESLAVSPDGNRLASGSFREVILWDVPAKKIVKRITGFADKVTAIAWSRSGNALATAGGAPTEDGELRIYSKEGDLLREMKNAHSDTVFGVAFSPDGKRLASGGADKFVRVFEAETGKLLKSFEGHTQHVLDVAWGPDGNRLVSAGADDLIKIWDFEKGEKARDLRGHTKQVTRIAFASSGVNFFTVSGDLSARRWSVETGDPSRTFADAKDFLYAVAVNAEGTLLATGGEEGVVRIYDTKANALQKTVTFAGPSP